ncbi:hypothetical protein V9T40_006685 [Parthenolecanium corni]|uniref:P/Homo B domain-containing protein n=1 Tax=Parthenolecanium corni TaxID=536013 RepID=A0AAN9TR66_9HEMI
MIDLFSFQKHHIPDIHLLINRRHPRKGKYENKKLTNTLLKYNGILWAKQIYLQRVFRKAVRCPGKSVRGPSNYQGLFNDFHFSTQWYLQDCRESSSHIQYDLNVVPVWNYYKIFGNNIKVMVIDDGLQIDHPDLRRNYDPVFGYDFVDYVDSPLPDKGFSHGTHMAGIIAMQANNQICGVGIAPLATLGAVRLVEDKVISDDQTAQAFTFQVKDLDISNNSWSMGDDGKALAELSPVIENAIKVAILEGRQSKGLIFVFLTGNEKQNGDTCAHDPYTSLIYTITVAGVKHDGSIISYSERCSNILVTAYSGDNGYGPTGHIVTTTTNSKCDTWVDGTSYATAIVSGVVALILEANNDLTWRELQHVFAWTSQVAALAHNKTWFRNKAGLYISQDFGFGLVDAFEAVTFAMFMKHIPSMNSCVLVPKIIKEDAAFNRKQALRIKMATNGCKNLPSEVNYIEHVQLMVSVEHQRRGAIQIQLVSPSGTQSTLLEKRPLDRSKIGLKKWFMDTVHLWAESPQGVWSIIFYDRGRLSSAQGTVTEIALIIHGTKYQPPHYIRNRTYKKFPQSVENI